MDEFITAMRTEFDGFNMSFCDNEMLLMIHGNPYHTADVTYVGVDLNGMPRVIGNPTFYVDINGEITNG